MTQVMARDTGDCLRAIALRAVHAKLSARRRGFFVATVFYYFQSASDLSSGGEVYHA